VAAPSAQAFDYLRNLSSRVKKNFADDRTILSFQEWFQVLLENPARNLRSASQYLRDVFDYYGTEERDLPQGKVRRYKLFDCPWSAGDGRVAGQEQVQQEIYRLLSNFVRDGRVSKLILLHGPNGSAKSSMVRAIQTGMENYSRAPEGALYSYAWIFPSEKIVKGRLGFGERNEHDQREEVGGSYAHLGSEQIDARLPCELRDHPIFFVPQKERAKLIEMFQKDGKIPADFVASRYILDGDLSPRDRAIYDALLMANDGDHAEVLRHVQVERFVISLKYGRAVGTVEPQMHVDAEARQLTADRSIANLPRSLQSVPLYEIGGPLVNANRGLLEYSDLLKRPLEAFKYLLTTSEEASASLPQFKIHLDEVLIASSNEKQLEAFKEYPDWNSFKGRIELVTVPYLKRFNDEIEIYERKITPSSIDRPLAPHVVESAAMWAVLTRLKWPDPEHYDAGLREVIRRLKPVEKLKLYDFGEIPRWCTAHQARDLGHAIGKIYDEYRTVLYYEGQRGASAREIRTLILNASHHPKYRCLTPLPVFDELHELVRDSSLYEFLKQEPRGGYHENAQFIETVRQWWLDILDDEVRTSMGLVEEARYEELFAKYVVHVSHFLKREKLLDKITGNYIDPDQEFMREVENTILADNEDRDDFRKAMIGRIGAWSLDHSGKAPDYRKLFPRYVEKMEEEYYGQRRKVIAKNIMFTLQLLGDGQAQMSDDEIAVARRTVDTMSTRYKYPEACTGECLAYLLKVRYAGETS
jgi:serine protein kinase